jgi:glycerophosphoryl diester phosphodiesterase
MKRESALMPLRVSLLVVVTLVAGCQTSPQRPSIIAHRGGAMEAPENTLSACRRAIERGFDAVEIDARLSGDGRAVVIHDSTVDRTSGAKSDKPVRDLNLEQLQAFDVGSAFDARFAGQRIPTLDNVLRLPWSAATRLMIEVKREANHKLPEVLPDDRALADAVARAIRRAPARDGLLLASFSAVLLRELHRRVPELPLVGIASTVEDVEPHLELPLDAIALNRQHVTPAFTQRMRGRRIQVWCWTVRKDTEIAPLLEAGVDGIITDIPTTVRTQVSGR